MPRSVIGQYRIAGVLGEGGMGVVYEAEHTLLGRPAALKLLRPELSSKQEIVQRFFNEARAATAIRHPGIVEIYDFGWTDDGAAFIVMELLQGETLRARRERGPMRWSTALTLVRQIAGALGAAHAKGIVHRDLKPDNIFLVPDPEVPGGERIKLLDFGIAKLAGSSAGHHMTRTGAVIGTPTYMAPEQCRGVAVDSRADLYALGCILFELCAGQPPFVGEGEGDVIAAHIHVPPPALGSVASGAPRELEALVQRLLAKAPLDRAQTAEEVIRLIDGTTSLLGGTRASTEVPALSTAASGAHAAEAAKGTIYSDTTLSSATGSHRIAQPPERRKRLVLIGAAAGSVALGVIIALAIGSSGGGGGAQPAAAAGSSESGASSNAKAPQPSPTAVPAAPPPETPTPSPSPPAPTPAPAPVPAPAPEPTAPPEPAATEVPTPSPAPAPSPAPSKKAAPPAKATVAKRKPEPPETPPPAKIDVAIDSMPAGAEVVRDGNVIGKTPFRLSMLNTGNDVKLTLQLRGYQPHPITVHTDAPSTHRVKLSPVAHDQAVNPFK